jgi:siroheme synthase-like protein
MRYLPIFLDVGGRACLVCGGGVVALRKVRTLLDYGARAVVIAPEVGPEIEELGDRVTIHKRPFRREDVTGGYALVYSATGDREVDAMVRDAAKAAGVPVNVVDRSEDSSFIMPAVLRRDPLQIAFSTSGASPAFSVHLRDQIAGQIGEEYSLFLRFMEELRPLVREKEPGERRDTFARMIESEALSIIREGLGRNDPGLIEKGRQLLRSLIDG